MSDSASPGSSATNDAPATPPGSAGAPNAELPASGAAGAAELPGVNTDEPTDDAVDLADAAAPEAPSNTADGGTNTPATDPEAVLQLFDAYWDFDTREGAVGLDPVSLDLTGGGNDLTLTGTEPAAGGLQGDALLLSDSMTSAESKAALLDTSTDFSISAWVRLDALHSFDTFVSQAGDNVSAFYLQKRDDDRFSFATFPGDDTGQSPCVTTAAVAPRPGEWVHLVATRDAASREQRLYVDGALSGKSRCTGDVFAAAGPLLVGHGKWDAADADWMDGAVDELGVSNSVLSARDVLDAYRAGRPDAAFYLFGYFVEVSQGRGDGLRLAYSHDGLYWGALGGGKVFMPPSVGGGSFRDPHLMRAPSGEYHLVFTTSCVPWAESNCVQDRGFGHAQSSDLVNWEPATYVPIDLPVEHVWAPETFYDAPSEQFMVFWSSPPTSEPHRIYYVLTQDFASFSEPQVLYTQPGRNFIDATIRQQGDGYLMVLKDEADGQKNLRALTSTALFGADAWQSAPSNPITGNYGAEGPSFLERDGELFVYFDKYGEGSYGALRATSTTELASPAAWEDISDSIFFPGVRHGTPIEVPWDVFSAVALAAAE